MDTKYIETWLKESGLCAKSDTVKLSRLGGLTNRNYLASTGDLKLVVRIPGKDTDLIINRNCEREIVEAIKDIDIDAPLVKFDFDTGIKVAKYIEGAITMSPESICDTHRIKQVASLFKRLHESEIEVDTIFDPFVLLENYEMTLVTLGGTFPSDYYEVKNQVLGLRAAQEGTPKRVICHNDPLSENFVVSSFDEMYLVDWEYSGMNDPLWDLADVSIEASYTEAQDKILLETYYGESADDTTLRSFILQKLYIDLLWSLWGYIRELTKDVDDTYDFLEYGNNRYLRLKVNLSLLV